MAKKGESLEEGLNESANKRGLSGKDRHRYIGGALHNMGKAKTRSGKREPVTKKAPAAPHKNTAPTPHATPAPATPRKQAYESPRLSVRKHIHLTAKKNVDASKKYGYIIYSVYHKSGELYSDSLYRKLPSAKSAAKIAQDAHNEPRGKHDHIKIEGVAKQLPPDAPPKPKKKYRSHKNDPKQTSFI